VLFWSLDRFSREGVLEGLERVPRDAAVIGLHHCAVMIAEYAHVDRVNCSGDYEFFVRLRNLAVAFQRLVGSNRFSPTLLEALRLAGLPAGASESMSDSRYPYRPPAAWPARYR
jgi:hypothetical protein